MPLTSPPSSPSTVERLVDRLHADDLERAAFGLPFGLLDLLGGHQEVSRRRASLTATVFWRSPPMLPDGTVEVDGAGGGDLLPTRESPGVSSSSRVSVNARPADGPPI